MLCPQSLSEPPSPTFEIYQSLPSTSEQSEAEQYAPHVLRNRIDYNSSIRSNPPPPMLRVNTQPTAPSIFPPSQNGGHSPTFPDGQFDTTFPHFHGDGVYNYSESFVEPPAPYTSNRVRQEDIIDPPHSPQYLRRHVSPSLPLSQSNLNSFASANPISLGLNTYHVDAGSYIPPLSPIDFPTTSSSLEYSPTLYSEDSSPTLSTYDLL